MNEKEERLYIVRYPSRLIPEATGITVTRKKFNSKSFTRSEAVDRMAHALCVKVHGPCDMCGNVKNGNEGHCNDYKSYAAAALDALVDK